MRKETKISLIVISALALLNVMFVPIFEVWGGLTPDNISFDFFEIMEALSNGGDCWNRRVVQLTVFIFGPSLFMFAMSLIGQRGLVIASSVAGVVFWFIQIYDYVDRFGVDDLLDFENTSVSIGTWFALALFVIAFFTALGAKKKTEENNGNYNQSVTSNEYAYETEDIPYQNPQQPISQPPFPEQSNALNNYCPKCGATLKESASFCGVCGNKL